MLRGNLVDALNQREDNDVAVAVPLESGGTAVLNLRGIRYDDRRQIQLVTEEHRNVPETSANTDVVYAREGVAGRTLLDVRGHALEIAAAHHQKLMHLDADDAEATRREVTRDAAAYERYLLTGAVHRTRRGARHAQRADEVPVTRSALVKFLREMDLQQGRTDDRGQREIAWHHRREDLERLLGLEDGALCAADADGSYPEADEDVAETPKGGPVA